VQWRITRSPSVTGNMNGLFPGHDLHGLFGCSQEPGHARPRNCSQDRPYYDNYVFDYNINVRNRNKRNVRNKNKRNVIEFLLL